MENAPADRIKCFDMMSQIQTCAWNGSRKRKATGMNTSYFFSMFYCCWCCCHRRNHLCMMPPPFPVLCILGLVCAVCASVEAIFCCCNFLCASFHCSINEKCNMIIKGVSSGNEKGIEYWPFWYGISIAFFFLLHVRALSLWLSFSRSLYLCSSVIAHVFRYSWWIDSWMDEWIEMWVCVCVRMHFMWLCGTLIRCVFFPHFSSIVRSFGFNYLRCFFIRVGIARIFLEFSKTIYRIHKRA